MSGSSRLAFNGDNLLAGATIKNGSGGGAPARLEVTPYVMERALNDDRCTVWQLGTSGTGWATYFADFDLGAAFDVDCAMLLGINSAAQAFKIYSSPGYFPTGGQPVWTLRGTNSGSDPRDQACLFGTVNARYWRFEFFSAAATVGRLWLGKSVDLGILYSRDSSDTPGQTRLEQKQQDGSYVVNVLGYASHDFDLAFNNVPPVTRDKLRTIAAQPGSFMYLDGSDNVFECIAAGGRVPTHHAFLNSDSVPVTAVRLP